MTIGNRIKNRRIELNLTQDELARKCGYKSRSSVNKIELSRELPLRKIEIMARALECTPSYLMGWTEELENRANQTEIEEIRTRERDEAILQKYLSHDESLLIMAYRLADDETRDNIMHIANNVIKRGRVEKSSNFADKGIA